MSRLVLTALAVAVGVSILLGVFAEYNGFEKTSGRQCWECTTAALNKAPAARSELWNYSENIYRGSFVEQLDVAPLGPRAPVPPGMAKLPAPGQFYASPALAHLLATVPADELGDRFHGHLAGTIGVKALSGPTALVVVIGYTPSALAKLPGTVTVDHIATGAELEGTTRLYQMGFGIAVLAVLFPLMILINTATRLAAARREERYAAMRLVGATPRQVNVIASVDAIVSALAGALLGTALFLAVRPALADISFNGQRFFSQYVTPTAPGYALMLVGVPLASALASLWSLHRVRISPLGVSRRTRRRAPGLWRVLPLLGGIPLFIYGVSRGGAGHNTNAVIFIGFALILVGLVVGGTWLTMQGSRLLARRARSAASLLAARRLADDPKASFRTVSGLVLAVFIGTAIATLVPVFNRAESNLGGAHSLADVLRVPFNEGTAPGLNPATGVQLMAKLHTYAGVQALPIYTNMANFEANGPGAGPVGQGPPAPPPPVPPSGPDGSRGRLHTHIHGGYIHAAPGAGNSSSSAGAGRRAANAAHRSANAGSQYDSIVPCAAIGQFPALGSCAGSKGYVYANLDNMLFTDNPLDIAQNLPAVTAANPQAPSSTGKLYIAAVLLRAPSTATLEKVRTFLTDYDLALPFSAGAGIQQWQMGAAEPETFGEVAQIRNSDINNIEAVVLAIVGLTLLVAACSLAVTAGGGIVERKRSFTMLRVAGTAQATLARVVLLEATLPLLGAAVAAAAVAIGISTPLIDALPVVGKHNGVDFPGAAYYIAMGSGLAIALGIVALTLPVLSRVTGTEKARFE
ncbi:MAG TPA: FtsX-like permease family protein [Acidimicrobiales bacterium]|nr:FtsX-like permease family protein [Acidimicrobiales bacterium]